jgi:hypothetical protein
MGDRKLLEEAIFWNCQFLQVGRYTETVKSRRTRRGSRTRNLRSA